MRTIPTYRHLYLLAGHPETGRGVELPERSQVISMGRTPESAGHMSRTWNTAMLWAFRDPEVEWLLCSMDDVEVQVGWVELISQHDADLYVAPAGDLAFLFNRKVLREVGWFDERFVVNGFQEWDWQARAIRGLSKDRVSISDAHGWSHHPIGLDRHWQHMDRGTPTTQNMQAQGFNRTWLETKWGCGFASVIGMLASGEIPEPKVNEMEWYPWFAR
jgi:hypothetical protein